jgi:hypothetical protein
MTILISEQINEFTRSLDNDEFFRWARMFAEWRNTRPEIPVSFFEFVIMLFETNDPRTEQMKPFISKSPTLADYKWERKLFFG